MTLPLLRNASPAVAQALQDWAEQRKPKSKPAAGASVTYPDAEGKYTPTRLASSLKTQLTKYIEGAYPLRDTTLIKARRRLLLSEESGRLLAQDPFVETTPRYRGFDGGYEQLGLDAATASFLARLARPGSSADADRSLLFPGLYAHQADAFKAFLGQGQHVVVATGTGSGKTECFLVPVLASLQREATARPTTFRQRGVRCLILYPMNALVNDQMARLRLLFGDERLAKLFREETPGARHVTFGMYTGRTPYPGPRDPQRDEERVRPLLDYYLNLEPDLERELRRLGRYPAKDLRSFLAAGKIEQRTVVTEHLI